MKRQRDGLEDARFIGKFAPVDQNNAAAIGISGVSFFQAHGCHERCGCIVDGFGCIRAATDEGLHDFRLNEFGCEPVWGRANQCCGQAVVLGIASERRAFRDLGIRIRAVRKQVLDEREIAPEDRCMERRIANPRCVGIRAFFQQQARDGAVAAVGSKDKRAHSIRQRIVDIGAGRKQQPKRFDVSRTRGEQQWCASTAEHGVVELLASRALRHLARDGLCIRA